MLASLSQPTPSAKLAYAKAIANALAESTSILAYAQLMELRMSLVYDLLTKQEIELLDSML